MPVREPNALIAHVRFDEREVETGQWKGYLGTGSRKGRQQTSLLPVTTAPLLDSTGSVDPRSHVNGKPAAGLPVTPSELRGEANQLISVLLYILSCKEIRLIEDSRRYSATCVKSPQN